ncbi:MAG TPA: hypothetical protein VFX54_09150, partial [Candidatus Binatia bacterium]|nr:hypothetical protein [Candidatus Binatia bacterium]
KREVGEAASGNRQKVEARNFSDLSFKGRKDAKVGESHSKHKIRNPKQMQVIKTNAMFQTT